MARRANIFYELLTVALMASIYIYSSSIAAQEDRSSPTERGDQIAVAITIEVGTTSVPPRARRWFEGEIRSFMKAHPNIKVETLALVEPLRPQTKIEDLPRLAENVVGIVGATGYETSYLASRELIVPIQKFLPDPAFNFDDFYDNAWPSVTYDGKIWGVPWCLDSIWLVCDWPLFEAEGITEAPRTWEEFVKVAQRLTKDTDGDGVIDQWGFRLPNDRFLITEALWLSMLRQNETHWFSENGIDLSGIKVREVFDFLYALHHAEYVKRDNRLSFAGFGDETIRCGMQVMFTFGQNIPYVANVAQQLFKKKRFRFAYLPTFGNEVGQAGARLFLAVRKSTPEKEAASWEFVKWINRPDAALPEFWFGNPVRKDFIEREDFKKWTETACQDFEIAFKAMSWLATGSDLYWSLWTVDEITRPNLRAAFKDEITFETCMSNIEREIVKLRLPKFAPVQFDRLLE